MIFADLVHTDRGSDHAAGLLLRPAVFIAVIRKARHHYALPALAFLAGAFSAPATSVACGYHDPLAVQQGILNFMYPDALHVTGAIWTQQQAGVLPMPFPKRVVATGDARARFDSQAMFEVARAVLVIEEEIKNCADCPDQAFSMLGIEKMMWSHFGPDGTAQVHGLGADKKDLVVVYGEPVVLAIAEAKLSVTKAHDLGLLRLYGQETQKQAFLTAYGRIGESVLAYIPDASVYDRLYMRQPLDPLDPLN